MAQKKTSPGICYLVGAGPGDPGLLTIKGKECIEAADVPADASESFSAAAAAVTDLAGQAGRLCASCGTADRRATQWGRPHRQRCSAAERR